MKKLLISLAVILLTVGMANAQTKEIQKALKELEKAKALVQKKGDKADSWLKLADAYRNCYEAPINGLAIGSGQLQTKVCLNGQYPVKQEQKTIGGKNYLVETYANKELYYDEAGNLRGVKVLTPVLTDEDALAKAKEYYAKAKEMGVSQKDLAQSMQFVCNDYWDMAMTGNNLNDYKLAALGFEECYKAGRMIDKVDTVSVYYGAIMATLAGQKEKAIEMSNECLALGKEDGNLYAMLAENYKASGDMEKAKDYLQKGFEKFPTSQEILVSLINVLLDANESPEKVFDYLHAAQQNEPTNASLYYSEGNLYKQLKQYDKAVELYQKASEVDPKYFYAPYAEGEVYYQMALDIQDAAAQELDDEKYAKLLEQIPVCLKKAIDPFTKAFEVAGDDLELKQACAEYLKEIFFRFKDESAENEALYNKYLKIAKGEE